VAEIRIDGSRDYVLSPLTSLLCLPDLAAFARSRPLDNESLGRIVYGAVQAGESTADYRTRMARIQAEALEQWQKQLAEQSSVLNSPSDRIRVWERRHQIELPRDPAHRLIKLIAANTGLSTEEVYEEQRLRAETRTNLVAAAL
jgi:hypothetical protein